MEQKLAMTAVEETLRASDGSAARFASAQVPVAEPGDRVGDVRRTLVGRRFDSASAVAVCADEILIGLVRIEDLLAADGDTTVEMVIDPNPPRLTAGIDEEQAAWRAVHRGESTLAVVDDDGGLVGLVAPARLLGIALEKHAGDLARLGGYLHRTGDARATSEEPVARRFRHRLPWLALGLIGALLSAGIVGSFERMLQAKILLASFLPGIVYMADAVGTQTETLMIRGLSVGVAIRKVARLEVLTGLLVGLALAVTFGVVGAGPVG
jgi:magnesium transporter